MAPPDIKDIIAQFEWFQEALDSLLAEPNRPLPTLPPKFGIGSGALAELQQSFETLATRYHELHAELQALRVKGQVPESEPAPVTEDNAGPAHRIEELTGTNQALRYQLAALSEEHEQLVEAHRAVERHNEDLRRQIQDLTDARTRLTEETNQLAEERRALHERLEGLTQTLQELRSQEQELSDLRLAHEALAAAHSHLQAEHRAVLTRLEELTIQPRISATGKDEPASPVEDPSQREAFLETLKRELAASAERLREEARQRIRSAFDPDK
jgi:DNA repair exonuclease SbcCD ATPase subunit